jgi:hypothetical protein
MCVGVLLPPGVFSGALDALFEQIDSGLVQLSGAGGLLPELMKAV